MLCLDWSAPHHWNQGHTAVCVHCGTSTHLLDDADRPAHKVCVERLLSDPVVVRVDFNNRKALTL